MDHMKKTGFGVFGLVLPILAMTLGCGVVQAETALQLERALLLDGPEMLQPSGLSMIKGNLYLVSCKHDDQVFEVSLGRDKATYKEAFHIARPADAASLKFVWRGLSADDNGNLLLLSETAYRVLRLDKKGNGEWLGTSVLDAGTEIGLFGGDNSGPDGITSLGKNQYLVGASREPRGLIRITQQGGKSELKPQKCEKSKASIPTGRKPDFTDLASVGSTVYALVGVADAVCTLKPDGEGDLAENDCYSFAAAAQDAQVRYKGLKGLARGLAADDAHLYIVLDNKGLSREADPKDRRPTLLVFKRPG